MEGSSPAIGRALRSGASGASATTSPATTTIPETAQHLFEETRAAAGLFELRCPQGLPAFKKSRLPLQGLIKDGNVDKLDELPADSRRGDNTRAFEGGFRLWRDKGLIV